MKRNNNDLLKEKLNEMWNLLQPKDSEVFKIGDMVICKSLLSDNQLREGQEILNEAFSPSSRGLEDFAEAIVLRVRYFLLDKEAEHRNAQNLRKELWKCRKRIDGEDWKDGPAPPDSGRD